MITKILRSARSVSVLCVSQNRQPIFALYCIQWLVFITEMAICYCAVRTGSLNKTLRFVLQRLITTETTNFMALFLNRQAAARYRALTSIIPGRERFSWKLSF